MVPQVHPRASMAISFSLICCLCYLNAFLCYDSVVDRWNVSVASAEGTDCPLQAHLD